MSESETPRDVSGSGLIGPAPGTTRNPEAITLPVLSGQPHTGNSALARAHTSLTPDKVVTSSTQETSLHNPNVVKDDNVPLNQEAKLSSQGSPPKKQFEGQGVSKEPMPDRELKRGPGINGSQTKSQENKGSVEKLPPIHSNQNSMPRNEPKRVPGHVVRQSNGQENGANVGRPTYTKPAPDFKMTHSKQEQSGKIPANNGVLPIKGKDSHLHNGKPDLAQYSKIYKAQKSREDKNKSDSGGSYEIKPRNHASSGSNKKTNGKNKNSESNNQARRQEKSQSTKSKNGSTFPPIAGTSDNSLKSNSRLEKNAQGLKEQEMKGKDQVTNELSSKPEEVSRKAEPTDDVRQSEKNVLPTENVSDEKHRDSDRDISDNNSFDKRPSDQSDSDKTTSDKSSSHKSDADKSDSDKTTSDKSSSHKSDADKSDSDKTTSDKSSSQKSDADMSDTDKATSDKSSSQKSDADKATSDKSSSQKSDSESSSDRSTSDKSNSDRSTSYKSNSDQDISDSKSSTGSHKSEERFKSVPGGLKGGALSQKETKTSNNNKDGGSDKSSVSSENKSQASSQKSQESSKSNQTGLKGGPVSKQWNNKQHAGKNDSGSVGGKDGKDNSSVSGKTQRDLASNASSRDAGDRKPANRQKKPDTSSQRTEKSNGGSTDRSTDSTSETKETPKINPTDPSRLYQLTHRGEWIATEHALKNVAKGGPAVNYADPETGVTPLMLMVKESRLVLAERLLENGAEINKQAKDGRTALHYATAHAKDDCIRMLLNHKPDASIRGGPKNQLPLHMVCMRTPGSISCTHLLLKAAGKDLRLTKDQDGMIPAFLAMEAGNGPLCRELLGLYTEQQLNARHKETGDSLLHMACRRKDHETVRLLVELGSDVDAQNKDGQTPLHISASEGDETMVKHLHMCKANPNVYDNFDRTPLHLATENGHTGLAEMLVDRLRANVAARTKDGSTLIHIAAQFGHPETALSFLKKGVPLLMPNKNGAICLHSAAMRGHIPVIKALIQKGATVDAKTKDGYTALHIAVECGRPQAVQTLLGYGAQVEFKGGKVQETPLHIAARVKDGEKCGEMLVKSGANINAVQQNGETALHIAARNGHLKMCNSLLAEGADATWQSKMGESPLHVAVRHCHYRLARALLQFVTKNKSRIDAVMLVNLQNSEGETAVHFAAELSKKQAHQEFEDTDIIKLLLEYDGDTNIQTKLTHETPMHYNARAGNADILLEMVKHIPPAKLQASINKQAKNGWSPLLVASECGHIDILKIHLQNHARVDVFDEHGKAALHLAAENGHIEVANVLLSHKAFVNAKSKVGVTPLHLAAQNGYNALVKLLVEKHDASIDALTLAKKTPLHLAAQNGQIDVCLNLLTMKADSNATDVHGQTPLHLAAEHDHSDVIKLFLKHRPELVSMANTNGMTCAHIAASKGSVAVLKELMKFNKNIVTTIRNRTNNSTTLHLAAAGGHAEVVKALIEAGTPATDENKEGMTCIHLAARHGHTQVLWALGEKVSWRIYSTKTGLTALHVASQFGQVDFVREMLTKVPATLKSEAPQNGQIGFKEFLVESGLTPLHLAAQSGHEGLVRLLLNSQGVQVDAPTAVHGSIPLHLAAKSGHTAVVSLLLSKSTNQLHVKDKRGRTCLHLAAANGHIDMVALFLGQGADINCYDKNGWTPMHFSAKAGHLEVVKMLCEGGAIPTYETKEGKTPICFAAAANHADVLSYLLKKEHSTEQLTEDKKFILDLMAVGKLTNNRSIQEFILISPAPVDTAAKMSRNFRILAVKEKDRSRDLFSAGEYCETMATDLNAIAASKCSAGMLLKAVDSRGMPFLDVLIEYEQKEVVSHSMVQRYLSDVWMGRLSNWSSWKMILLFTIMLLVPPVWLLFSLPIRHRYNKIPVIKFMCYLVSHVYLIVLFYITVVTPIYRIWLSYNLLPHWYEWLLLAWLSGLLVSELTNPGDRTGLGWLRVIVIVLSAIALLVHVLAFAFIGNDRLYCLYIRNQFFALALLLCFVQMLDFLQFHHLFGPWAIIIRDLMKDLLRFLVILLIFMVGFTLHLTAAYQPVLPPDPDDPSKGTANAEALTPLDNPIDTFVFLFFALFGLVEPENLPSVHRNPSWTITLVRTVFGVYLIITLIVLINLLIAMMSDTYQRIQAQSDTEWKFGRAKLFRNMNKTSATPTPLNLFTKLFTYIRVAIKHRGKICKSNIRHIIEEEEELGDQADSRSVDVMGSGHGNWFRGRRNTQVAPHDHTKVHGHGRMRIEDVVDWRAVSHQYLVMQGLAEGETSSPDMDLKMEDMNGNADVMMEQNGKADIFN